MDHLQTMKRLGKTYDYNISIHLALLNFHKAFVTIEKWQILRPMDNARIGSRHSNLIHNIHTIASMQINIDEELINFQLVVASNRVARYLKNDLRWC